MPEETTATIPLHQNSALHFSSFMMAGFECTYALAERGKRFDLLHASRHDERVKSDYELLLERGIKTVREGFAWHQIDRGSGNYDFSRFHPLLEAAQELGIQQIWDLSHFDFPEDLDPFSDVFVTRYAAYASAVCQELRTYTAAEIYICPMNEASFFAWMCDRGLWAPYKTGQGTAFKMQLIRAAIAAMDAIWAIDGTVKFIHIDPYMYRVPLRKRSQIEQNFCDDFNENVRFFTWDAIAGRIHPELGGNPKYLNCIGINYYFYNQQKVGISPTNPEDFCFRTLSLTDPRRRSLTEILSELSARYTAPLIISETGSYRTRRPGWWKYLLEQVSAARDSGVPLYGVCAYPTLDILKGAGFIVPQSGLWDFDQTAKSYERIPHEPTWEVLAPYIKSWQKHKLKES